VAEPLPLRLPEPIVVLGGGGFIGANLVRRLRADGYEAWAIDIAPVPWREVDAEWLDLRHITAARRAIIGARTVFHLAADMGGVGYFHSDADFAASTDNGRITINVARACAESPLVERLFYASSACVYPVELQHIAYPAVKLREDIIGFGTPDALYGAEKLQGLRIMAKLPFARVGVLHTVYGPLQEHEGRRMKFPAAAATKALDALETGTLELWGDGSQRRSYLYVDDAVDRIIEVTAAEHYGGPVNIGATGAASCREVAEMCLRIVGASDATITTNEAEPTGVLGRDCDGRKYERYYGAPHQTSLAAGFTKFIDWLKEVR